MKIGYARVSTADQNLELQRDALINAGCEKIFEEKKIQAKQVQNGPHSRALSNTCGPLTSWLCGSSIVSDAPLWR